MWVVKSNGFALPAQQTRQSDETGSEGNAFAVIKGQTVMKSVAVTNTSDHVDLCFSTAGPRPGTGPRYQLYRAARGSPGISHFSFISNFHE